MSELHTLLPQTLLGKALHCAAGQWEKLRCYADDGRFSIVNIEPENPITPFSVGRNWLFGDSVANVHTSAKLAFAAVGTPGHCH